MPSLTDLEKRLKSATKTGKWVVGRKEVLSSLKGSKLLVWSASANVPSEILSQCKSLQVPALRFDGDPMALGATCGIPYKVSVLAVKSSGDADLSAYANSQDYSSPRSRFSPEPVQTEAEAAVRVEEKSHEELKKKVKKTKKVSELEAKEKPKKEPKKTKKKATSD